MNYSLAKKGPTLSELIEACQSSLKAFRLDGSMKDREWIAYGFRLEESTGVVEGGVTRYPNIAHATGKTPEEAVANLYIALKSRG